MYIIAWGGWRVGNESGLCGLAAFTVMIIVAYVPAYNASLFSTLLSFFSFIC